MPAAGGVSKALLAKQEKAQERALKAAERAEEAARKARDAASKAAAAKKKVDEQSKLKRQREAEKVKDQVKKVQKKQAARVQKVMAVEKKRVQKKQDKIEQQIERLKEQQRMKMQELEAEKQGLQARRNLERQKSKHAVDEARKQIMNPSQRNSQASSQARRPPAPVRAIPAAQHPRNSSSVPSPNRTVHKDPKRSGFVKKEPHNENSIAAPSARKAAAQGARTAKPRDQNMSGSKRGGEKPHTYKAEHTDPFEWFQLKAEPF